MGALPHTERSDFLDRIPVLLTVLAVLHHTAIRFGGDGGWYFRSPASSTLAEGWLTLLCPVDQSFFIHTLAPVDRERLRPLGLQADAQRTPRPEALSHFNCWGCFFAGRLFHAPLVRAQRGTPLRHRALAALEHTAARVRLFTPIFRALIERAECVTEFDTPLRRRFHRGNDRLLDTTSFHAAQGCIRGTTL